MRYDSPMWWKILQGSIWLGVTTWLTLIHASSNPLAVGVMGLIVAHLSTVFILAVADLYRRLRGQARRLAPIAPSWMQPETLLSPSDRTRFLK